MSRRSLLSAFGLLATLAPGATLAVGATAAPAAAQEPTREVQVPFDSLRAVLEVGPDLRRELGLFPEVAAFEAARLFLAEDGRTVLEVTARPGGRLVRERRTLSPGDLEDLRGRLALALDAPGRGGPRLAREGRGGLVLAETVLGLGFYGGRSRRCSTSRARAAGWPRISSPPAHRSTCPTA